MNALAVAGLFAGAALILIGLGLATGMGKIRDARRMLDRPYSGDWPLYDRTIDECRFDPEEPFTAGVETDIVQALRFQDELDDATLARIWQPVGDELARRRRG